MEGAGKLTPDEMKFYRGVFVTLDWMGNKQINCNPQLKLLLQSSRLPVATLGQLWTLSYALATNQKRDWLSDRDLCIVLRLIAMAQTGQVPSYEGSRVDGLPLPKIDINFLRESHKKAVEEGKVPAPGAAAAPAATQPEGAGTPARPAAPPASPAPTTPASPPPTTSATPATPAPARPAPSSTPAPATPAPSTPAPAPATPAPARPAASATPTPTPATPAPTPATPAPTPATPARPTAPTPASATPATSASPSPAASPAQPTAAASPSPASAANPASPTGAAGFDWSMSDKQRADYTRSFEQLDPEKKGILPALNAVGFLRKSKLPEDILREIWKLSDLGRDGALDLTEFCIAMHLVMKARSNVPLPPTLPACLMPGKPQAQVEAEEKAKKEMEAKVEASRKEQQEKEAREQQAKEQQEKEARERQSKEQQEKESREQNAKEQQEKEANERRAKEQQEREQQAKEQQEKQQAEGKQPTGEQKGEEKAASEQKEEQPAAPKSKFTRGDGASSLMAAAAARPPAPSTPARPAPSEESKRARSPAPRARSPATRANVKPGEPTVGWDKTVKLDREEAPAPLHTPSKPGDATKAQPAIRAWIETLLSEKIAPGLNLFDALKSGVRLCKALNIIEPNSILDIGTQPYMRRLNVEAFLDSLRKKGFKPNQLFVPDDLLEQQDMEAVYSTILELDNYAGKIGFGGARLKR